MHSANTDPKLTATEVALRSLIPAPPGIDRDRLMYEAGRQANRRRLWPLTAGFFAALSALLALRLASVPEPERPELAVSGTAPASPAAPRELPVIAKRTDTTPGIVELLLLGAPDSLPAGSLRSRQIDEWLRGGPSEVPLTVPGGRLPQFGSDGSLDSLLLRRGRL